jgi:hypothetical protein
LGGKLCLLVNYVWVVIHVYLESRCRLNLLEGKG